MLKTILADHNPVAQVTNGIFNKFPLLSNLADYLKQLLVGKQNPSLENLLFLIGVASLSFKTGQFLLKQYRTWNWLPDHFLANSKLTAAALKQKYGDGYVLITGFTDGIGLGFAQILAEFGFNLFLISRNNEKVTRVAQQLQTQYPDIKIEYAVSDLADLDQINSLEALFSKFDHIDICMIVNNAGSVAGGPFFQIDPKMLVDDANVDLVALFVINRILMPKLRRRRHRSAILNISSCTGVYLSPYVGVYSCTKRSLHIYSQILDLQNKDRVDVLSVTPFGVTTKMMKMKKGPFMITPRQCATATLADLLAGKKQTFTHMKHKISNTAFHLLNEDEAFNLYDSLWAQARAQAQ